MRVCIRSITNQITLFPFVCCFCFVRAFSFQGRKENRPSSKWPISIRPSPLIHLVCAPKFHNRIKRNWRQCSSNIFSGGKQSVVWEICKWRKERGKKILKARNNFCSERVDSIPFLYLVPAFLSPRKAAAPSLLSYLSLGGGVLCILRGVLWGRKFSNSVTEVIIQCNFFFLFISREPATWSANNCLQIMVCSCAMTSNCVWLQIIFCSRANETTQFSFMRWLFRENGRSLPIHWKTNLVIEWWNNCRTRLSQTITIFCSTSSNNC